MIYAGDRHKQHALQVSQAATAPPPQGTYAFRCFAPNKKPDEAVQTSAQSLWYSFYNSQVNQTDYNLLKLRNLGSHNEQYYYSNNNNIGDNCTNLDRDSDYQTCSNDTTKTGRIRVKDVSSINNAVPNNGFYVNQQAEQVDYFFDNALNAYQKQKYFHSKPYKQATLSSQYEHPIGYMAEPYLTSKYHQPINKFNLLHGELNTLPNTQCEMRGMGQNPNAVKQTFNSALSKNNERVSVAAKATCYSSTMELGICQKETEKMNFHINEYFPVQNKELRVERQTNFKEYLNESNDTSNKNIDTNFLNLFENVIDQRRLGNSKSTTNITYNYPDYINKNNTVGIENNNNSNNIDPFQQKITETTCVPNSKICNDFAKPPQNFAQPVAVHSPVVNIKQTSVKSFTNDGKPKNITINPELVVRKQICVSDHKINYLSAKQIPQNPGGAANSVTSSSNKTEKILKSVSKHSPDTQLEKPNVKSFTDGKNTANVAVDIEHKRKIPQNPGGAAISVISSSNKTEKILKSVSKHSPDTQIEKPNVKSFTDGKNITNVSVDIEHNRRKQTSASDQESNFSRVPQKASDSTGAYSNRSSSKNEMQKITKSVVIDNTERPNLKILTNGNNTTNNTIFTKPVEQKQICTSDEKSTTENRAVGCNNIRSSSDKMQKNASVTIETEFIEKKQTCTVDQKTNCLDVSQEPKNPVVTGNITDSSRNEITDKLLSKKSDSVVQKMEKVTINSTASIHEIGVELKSAKCNVLFPNVEPDKERNKSIALALSDAEIEESEFFSKKPGPKSKTMPAALQATRNHIQKYEASKNNSNSFGEPCSIISRKIKETMPRCTNNVSVVIEKLKTEKAQEHKIKNKFESKINVEKLNLLKEFLKNDFSCDNSEKNTIKRGNSSPTKSSKSRKRKNEAVFADCDMQKLRRRTKKRKNNTKEMVVTFSNRTSKIEGPEIFENLNVVNNLEFNLEESIIESTTENTDVSLKTVQEKCKNVEVNENSSPNFISKERVACENEIFDNETKDKVLTSNKVKSPTTNSGIHLEVKEEYQGYDSNETPSFNFLSKVEVNCDNFINENKAKKNCRDNQLAKCKGSESVSNIINAVENVMSTEIALDNEVSVAPKLLTLKSASDSSYVKGDDDFKENGVANTVKIFQALSYLKCVNCNLISPNHSFWINVVSEELRCLNCFKKMLENAQDISPESGKISGLKISRKKLKKRSKKRKELGDKKIKSSKVKITNKNRKERLAPDKQNQEYLMTVKTVQKVKNIKKKITQSTVFMEESKRKSVKEKENTKIIRKIVENSVKDTVKQMNVTKESKVSFTSQQEHKNSHDTTSKASKKRKKLENDFYTKGNLNENKIEKTVKSPEKKICKKDILFHTSQEVGNKTVERSEINDQTITKEKDKMKFSNKYPEQYVNKAIKTEKVQLGHAASTPLKMASPEDIKKFKGKPKDSFNSITIDPKVNISVKNVSKKNEDISSLKSKNKEESGCKSGETDSALVALLYKKTEALSHYLDLLN